MVVEGSGSGLDRYTVCVTGEPFRGVVIGFNGKRKTGGVRFGDGEG